MKPYQRLLFLGWLCLGLLAGDLCARAATGSLTPPGPAAGLAGDAGAAGAWVPTRMDNDANTRKGFDHFYNLEYDKAIHEFELAQQAHPDDPFAVNHLLGGIIFKELYRIGALDTEAYAADSFLNKKLAEPLDPAVHDRVLRLSNQALALSQTQLDKNPNNVDALYARGATRALQSTYIGIADHAWFSALRNAVAARHDNERVLELDPKYVDAKLVVGTHLYIIGSLSWPVRVAASVTGMSGNKQKGLDDLWQATGSNHQEVATDARIVLALFLRREQKYDEALQVVNVMQGQYPRNFLMATEYAHLLNAAGHGQEAIAAYRKVLAGCRANAYNQCRIEIPAYGLGEALRGQKQYAAAAEAYELAAGNGKDTDLRQRATLATGQMYDLMQQRDTALERYKAVIAENSTSISADMARHYLKTAYTNP